MTPPSCPAIVPVVVALKAPAKATPRPPPAIGLRILLTVSYPLLYSLRRSRSLGSFQPLGQISLVVSLRSSEAQFVFADVAQ